MDHEHQAESKKGEEEKGVLANSLTPASSDSGQCWWEEDSSRVRRKLDRNIVPLLSLAYLLAFLDRSNIGNAKVAGMNESLGIKDDAQYQWLLTIFYLSYILFQFLVMGYKIFPPSKWMGSAVICWGSISILQAAAFNWSGMMAARFFIGIAEAAFGAGVALYLSCFYPRAEVGLRFAFYVVGSAIASAIAGSVAYGLQQASTAIENWRLIFIVEAAPTILVGILIFFLLPDSIATARFLTPHERKVAEARLYRAAIDSTAEREDDADQMQSKKGSRGVLAFIASKMDVANALDAFKDPISYVNAALLFIVNVGYSSIPVYLPTILEGMGYTSLRAQAFSSPPYVAAFVFALSIVYISDRVDIRGCWIVLVTIIGAVGYLILAIAEENNVRYGAVWLVVIGLFSFIPMAYSWLIANTIGESKKGIALVIFSAIGQVGPILGTRLFPANQGPYYKKGMFVSAGMLLGGCLITAITLLFLWRLNHKKDAEMKRRLNDCANDLNSSSLYFTGKLDQSNPLHRQEIHRRRLDIAQHRESSIYFRYSL